MDETQAASVSEEENGAPAENVEAASEQTGAPATPPDGFIEAKRYEDLRSNHDRINSLVDRARQGDAEALRELTGFTFADDEEDQPVEEEQEHVEDPRVAAHDQWIQQQQQEATLKAFNSHLDKLAGSPDVLDDFDRQALLQESIANGFNESATEAAFQKWQQRQKDLEKKAIDRYLKSKRDAPFVPPVGTGANEVTDPLDGHARRERLAARMATYDE